MTRRFPLPLLSILALIVGLRTVGLTTYPFIMPDEGFWTSGPKNLVLFGSPLMDGRLHPFLSPATFAILSAVFWCAGPSITAARLFSVIAGLSSCALMALVGRRHLQPRAWLVLLLYGASGLVVIVDRTILLETHQIFWLLLAATLWLDERPGRAIAAGAAFGMALLVKSNSLYLVPAFCVSAPGSRAGDSQPRFPLVPLTSLFAMALLVAGVGYAAAWWLSPQGFASAFEYELKGDHLATQHVGFHYKRLGLNPHLLRITAREILFTDPFVCISGLVGMLAVLATVSAATRADRMFAAWAAFGLLSNVVQIYPQYRYVIATTPALAYLGAQLIDRRLSPRAPRGFVAVIVCGVVAYQVGQIGVGLYRRPNHPYWRAVEWITRNVPGDANVLAAPYIGISLPNRSYDFHRLIYDYDGSQHSLESVVTDYGISRIVADSQWRKLQNADMKQFLDARCRLEVKLEAAGIFVCRSG